MGDASLLTVDHVAVEINGIEALRDVTFDVARGERVGLVGETGSGKSLTARAIMGMLGRIGATISGGAIGFDGRDLATFDDRSWQPIRGRRIALIPQSSMSSLDPLMRIGSQLGEAIRSLTDAADVDGRARELLDQVQIRNADTVLRSYPHQLSGGMRQRVLIAMAIVANPDLLIADEATTALDVTVQRAVLDLIVRLSDELKASLILVSHDLDVVRSVTNKVVIMYAGRTIEAGPAEAVLHAPAHPYTQALVAARPSAVRPGELLASIPGAPPGLSDVIPGCAFAARCPVAVDQCREAIPPLRAVAAGHDAACVHVGESKRTDP